MRTASMLLVFTLFFALFSAAALAYVGNGYAPYSTSNPNRIPATQVTPAGVVPSPNTLNTPSIGVQPTIPVAPQMNQTGTQMNQTGTRDNTYRTYTYRANAVNNTANNWGWLGLLGLVGLAGLFGRNRERAD
ncbi:MAG: hypothetical protein A2189_01110 [Paenibacillus sp. RIFOXYA1_FULL_44_5]|nr:MAG: hypothetical protein A2189_01110 [Paenibacillus sp. RIFOXYA1_FULL_44_5]